MRRRILIFALVLVLAGGALRAQTATRRSPGSEPTQAPLKENITLRIHGILAEAGAVDVTWTGVGPIFVQTLQVARGNGTAGMRLEANITATATGYLVECQMDASVPAVWSEAGTTHYSSVASRTETTVRLKTGESAELVNQGGQAVTATLVAGSTDYAGQQANAPLTHARMAELDENAQLNFTGTGPDGSPMDITIGGTGPTFNADIRQGHQTINGVERPEVMHGEGILYRTDAGYYLTFQAVSQIAVVTARTEGANGNTTSVTYDSVGGTTTVALKLNEPVPVVVVNGQAMTVELKGTAGQ